MTDERLADYRRRLPGDQPADQGHAHHPRLGGFRDPGSRRAAEPAVRLPRGAAAAVVSGGSRGGRRTVAGDLGRRPGRRRDRRRRYRARAGVQLRADRPLPGGDRRPAHGARRADRACVHRPGNAAVRAGRPALFRIPMHSSGSSPSVSRRRSWRPFRPRCPARTPSASPGWRPGSASWKHAIARSFSSARSSTGRGSAMPTSAAWNRRGPSRSSRRSQPTRSIPRP